MAGYAFLVLAETVLIRKPFVGEHYQPKLFWSWRDWKNQSGQVIANIVMFVPVGLLLGRRFGWWTFLISVGMSVVIEFLQLITQRGLLEFDDVIHNSLGALIGVGIVMLIKRKREDRHEQT